jgi:hypothetical protein
MVERKKTGQPKARKKVHSSSRCQFINIQVFSFDSTLGSGASDLHTIECAPSVVYQVILLSTRPKRNNKEYYNIIGSILSERLTVKMLYHNADTFSGVSQFLLLRNPYRTLEK